MNLHWPRLKRIRRSSPASSGSWLSLSIHLLQLAWLFRNTDPARFPISQGRTLRTTLRLLLVYQTYPSAHLFDNLVAGPVLPPPLSLAPWRITSTLPRPSMARKALVDGPAGLGASLRLTSPRMGGRTCPPCWPGSAEPGRRAQPPSLPPG